RRGEGRTSEPLPEAGFPDQRCRGLSVSHPPSGRCVFVAMPLRGCHIQAPGRPGVSTSFPAQRSVGTGNLLAPEREPDVPPVLRDVPPPPPVSHVPRRRRNLGSAFLSVRGIRLSLRVVRAAVDLLRLHGPRP